MAPRTTRTALTLPPALQRKLRLPPRKTTAAPAEIVADLVEPGCKIAQGACSLREGKGIDGDTFLADMDRERAALERQRHG